jgi:hypothetical protein
MLPSSYPGRLASRNSSLFFSTEIFFITTLHGPRRKHSPYIVGRACLVTRCLAMYVLLTRAHACAGMCLPSRCLAMNIHVTVYIPCRTSCWQLQPCPFGTYRNSITKFLCNCCWEVISNGSGYEPMYNAHNAGDFMSFHTV